jgi:hypothetical protein
MKKILLFLSLFLLFTFNSISKEIDYSLLDVSDLLKKGFKIIKQEDSGGVTKVFLTNNRDFVVCRIMTGFSTICTKQ